MALGTLALIGTLTSLAGTIGSGIGSAVKNKQMDTNLRNSLAQSETDANREIYSNPLTRRDNMAYLRNLREQLKEQRERDIAKGKILGSTGEQETARQGQYADAYSKAISNLATINSSRRDNILNRLQINRLANERAVQNLAAARMQNWATLANNATTFGGKLMGLQNDLSGSDSDVTTDVTTGVKPEFNPVDAPIKKDDNNYYA